MAKFFITTIRTTDEVELKINQLKTLFLENGIKISGEKIRAMAVNMFFGTIDSLEDNKLHEFMLSIKKGEEQQIWKS